MRNSFKTSKGKKPVIQIEMIDKPMGNYLNLYVGLKKDLPLQKC